ncbi:DUF2304 domain-containing protein [bacterium]|nr:DUF2304 domain-containing protein [bacterium]
MWQQIIALIIILFFVSRLLIQKKKKNINLSEFIFWNIFWILAALAIIFLKQIDVFVSKLGFSSTGINFLLYLATMILFYLIFKLRLRLNNLENKLTKLTRSIAINEELEKEKLEEK